MMLPLAVAMDNVLIDASLALVALLVGVFGTLWYVRQTAPTSQGNSAEGQGNRRKRSPGQRRRAIEHGCVAIA